MPLYRVVSGEEKEAEMSPFGGGSCPVKPCPRRRQALRRRRPAVPVACTGCRGRAGNVSTSLRSTDDRTSYRAGSWASSEPLIRISACFFGRGQREHGVLTAEGEGLGDCVAGGHRLGLADEGEGELGVPEVS
jgi:hypothetical protein